jgi:hypothetical protein
MNFAMPGKDISILTTCRRAGIFFLKRQSPIVYTFPQQANFHVMCWNLKVGELGNVHRQEPLTVKRKERNSG